MEPSRNDFVGKTHRYETIGIDPLIGKNLWDNVAVSSPCIGQYKLTCLQNASVFSLFRLRALRSPLSTLVVLAGRFCLETAWCVTCFHCAPAWAVLGYSFVGCVIILLVAALYCSLVGCYYIVLSWLRCVALSWTVLPCPLRLFCVAPSWLH